MAVFSGLITSWSTVVYLPTLSVCGGSHTHNTGTWEAEAGGGLQVQAQSELHSKYQASQEFIHNEILPQTTKQNKQKNPLAKNVSNGTY